MSAQYKPYRDEESVDGLETTSWTDNEPGSIQIYEKTTEELPFNAANKRALWVQAALFILTGTLGFLLGYFGHFHPSDLTNNSIEGNSEPLSSRGHSSLDFLEDPTIKDKLLSQIDGNNILATLSTFKDSNRMPGSVGDQAFATFVQNAFDSYGLDPVSVTNYTFKTMLPAQRSIVKILDKNNKTIYSTLQYDMANDRDDDKVAFLPLSQAEATTITTNQLMYLNKGLKEDYAKLAALGLNANDTESKVFVIRQTFYQAHDAIINAQESGAEAILLFPDPDTYGSGSPFPESVQLPNDAARSHPLAWSNYGDLASSNLTLFAGIDTSKLGLDKESRVRIPVVLISFETAKQLLLGLSGTAAPKEWNCFDFTLHLGPGYKEDNGLDTRAKMSLEFHNHETSVTTTTVSGIIAGSVETDRYIVIGSRRDSLNRGLLDSVSGTAVMLEMARVFGGLTKQGWRPRRTIIFNSFGAESLNLVGSSNWLEAHQRVLHSRAVAYINCDLVVTGNQTVAISASPLLYQVLYNATKQVPDPNNPAAKVYSNWYEHHRRNKQAEIERMRMSDMHELAHMIKSIEGQLGGSNLDKSTDTVSNDSTKDPDVLGYHGDILKEYKRSALTAARPKVRRLDLHSIYSPFFLYSGIPVVDVRFAGFPHAKNQTSLLEDTLPLIGTRYDNLAAVQRIDPHLKYHVAVAQILSEILRDLSDSVYLPFNLLDYAITLRDSFTFFEQNYGKTFKDANLELDTLRHAIYEFTEAAVKFHHRQDLIDPKDALQVRKFNDQMMLVERAFLDPSNLPNYWERKHLILAPHDGQEHREGFPGLVDWITMLEGETLEGSDASIFIEVLKVHYRAVIYTISNAIKIIDEVQML